jgi:periplasmic protein CpxP/Spy
MRSLTMTAVATALVLGASSLTIAADNTSPGTTAPSAATGGAAAGTTVAPPTATGGTTGQSTDSAKASGTKDATSGTSSPKMTDAQVTQKLEMDGYTKITNLKEQQDGTWMGKAMHNGKEVSVGVDQTGIVTAK